MNLNEKYSSTYTEAKISILIFILFQSKLINKCGKVYNASQNGLTPLHFAVVIEGNKGTEMTRILLENGADPNLRADPDGSFFIQFEVSECQYKMIQNIVCHCIIYKSR